MNNFLLGVTYALFVIMMAFGLFGFMVVFDRELDNLLAKIIKGALFMKENLVIIIGIISIIILGYLIGSAMYEFVHNYNVWLDQALKGVGYEDTLRSIK